MVAKGAFARIANRRVVSAHLEAEVRVVHIGNYTAAHCTLAVVQPTHSQVAHMSPVEVRVVHGHSLPFGAQWSTVRWPLVLWSLPEYSVAHAP